jgi:hypothetical protein
VNRQQSLAAPFADPGTIFNNCTGNSFCRVSLDLSSNDFGSNTVSFGYECINQVYKLGIDAPSRSLFYIMVGIDIFLCLTFLAFYISEKRAEKVEEDYFKCQQLSLDDFSLKLKGFTMETYEEELDLLLRWMARRLGDEFMDGIVQVKTPDRVDFIEYQVRKETAYKKLYDFVVREFFDKEVNPCKFKSPSDFVDYCFAQELLYEAYRKSLILLVEDYLSQVYRPSTVVDPTSHVSIYMVFSRVWLKERALSLRQGSWASYIKVQDRKYEVSDAPAPDLILWKNKGKNLILRSIVSWFVTLTICFASYAFFGFLQLEQNKLLADFNFNINC